MKFVTAVLLMLALGAPARAQDELVPQGGPRGAVRALAISPDGTRLAALADQSVQVWTRGGGVLWTATATARQSGLAWSADGKRLAITVAPSDEKMSGGLRELDARTGQTLRRLHNPYQYEQVVYNAEGKPAALDGGGMTVWDDNGVAVRKEGGIQYDAEPFDGYRLRLPAVGKAKARSILLYPYSKEPHSYGNEYRCVAFAPDKSTVLCARTDFPHVDPNDMDTSESGMARSFLWRVDTRSGKVQTLRNGVAGAVFALALWPDGTAVLGGASAAVPSDWQGELRFIGVSDTGLKALWSAPQPLESVQDAHFSPTGAMLATGGMDTAVRLWNTGTARLETSLKQWSSAILALRFSPDGKRIAAQDYNHLFVWDIAAHKAEKFAGADVYEGATVQLAWSPDGKRLALGGQGGAAVWDSATKKEQRISGGDSAYGPVQWTREGLWVSGGGGAGGEEAALQRRDAATGRVTRALRAKGPASEAMHGGAVKAFQVYGGGRRVWSLGGDIRELPLTLKRWDVAKDRVERTLGMAAAPRCFALSPDEKTLAVGTAEGVSLFDSETLAPKTSTAFGAPVNQLAWSPGGQRLAAACGDGWTRLLDPAATVLARLAILPAPAPRTTGYEWVGIGADGGVIHSDKAGPLVRWRHDGELLPLDAHPELVRASLDAFGPVGEVTPAPVGATPVPAAKPVGAVAPSMSLSMVGATGPQLVLQGLGAERLADIAVANGGKWIASSDESQNEVRLWEGRSGLQWGAMPGRKPLLFTPDGTRLFLPADDDGSGEGGYNRVVMREVPSGRQLAVFALPSGPLWTDGQRLRGLKGGRLVDFDLASGRLIHTQALDGRRLSENFALSANGAFVCNGGMRGSDPVARVWRASDGKLVGQVRDKLRVIGNSAISSDGKWLVTEGEDPAWKRPQDAASEAAYARSFRIHIWDLRTKKLRASFPWYYSLSDDPHFMRFTPDSRALLTVGGGLHRYDLATGTTSDLPPPLKGQGSPLSWPLGVSEDGQWLAGRAEAPLVGFEPGLQLWNIPRRARTVAFAGSLRSASEVKWSPDGKWLAGGYRLVMWNAASGQLRADIPDSDVNTLEWRDKQTVVTTGLQTVSAWSTPSGKKLWQRPLGLGNQDDFMGIGYSDGANFSPDGALLLSGNPTGSGGGLFVRDSRTLATVRAWKTVTDGTGSSDLERMVWSPDSKLVLRGTKTGCEILNVRTGALAATLRDPIDADFRPSAGGDVAMLPLAVTNDGRLAAIKAIRDQSVWIYDLGAKKYTVQLVTSAGDRGHFLKDNRTLVVDGADGLEWWDATGAGKAALRAVRGTPRAPWNFSPDETRLAFGDASGSGGVQIWNVAQGRKRLTLFALGGNPKTSTLDWIALTPEGYYTASPGGEKRLRWREKGVFWPVERSRARFWSPGKVGEAMGGGREALESRQ